MYSLTLVSDYRLSEIDIFLKKSIEICSGNLI
jgi:hypothetical protein